MAPFSKTSQYAILVMDHIARQERQRLLSIQEISESVQVPAPFLRKIITLLTRAKLVRARRGPNGGVMLNRPAGEITVSDIVEAVDGPFGWFPEKNIPVARMECNGIRGYATSIPGFRYTPSGLHDRIGHHTLRDSMGTVFRRKDLDSQQCVLSWPECSSRDPCPLHEPWQQVKVQLIREMHAATLAKLSQSRQPS